MRANSASLSPRPISHRPVRASRRAAPRPAAPLATDHAANNSSRAKAKPAYPSSRTDRAFAQNATMAPVASLTSEREPRDLTARMSELT